MQDFNLINHIKNNDDNVVVWIFNIGLEKYWNGEVYTVKDVKENIIVNHMEEMNLLLTKKQDVLILRSYPEPVFLQEMERLGCEIPHIICPSVADESKSISELVLEDKTLEQQLFELTKGIKNVFFVPYGVCALEEEIAKRFGFILFGSPNEVSKMVNNKVFSRQFALENDFEVADGRVCLGIEELENVSRDFLGKYEKIIIKEPCGASGKGLWIVDSEQKLKSVLLIVKRFFKERLNKEWLVEEWCDKKADINYQIYVGMNGEIEVFSVKQQIVEDTVYVGSVVTPDFSDDVIKKCERCGKIIGQKLYQKGYRGILGVDAMILNNGKLISIIEINGRFTLSTYVSFIQNMVPGKKVFAFYKKVAFPYGMNYVNMKKILSDNKLWIERGNGVFVYTSETIKCSCVGDSGRIFALIFAEDDAKMKEMYNDFLRIMEEC